MDENPTVDLLRAFVERLEARDWSGFADLLHRDVIYRLPQTGEVVRGRDAYLRWNREYPDVWHLRLAEAYGDATGGVARITADIEGEGTVPAIMFVTVEGSLITEINDWWPTSYEPPPGREHLVVRE
jgi:hypothetical protein